jgi:hypothetical protein
MNRSHLTAIACAFFLSSLALTGCKKKEEPVPAPTTVEPAPAPTPAPAPVAVATIRIDNVELGNAVGADMKITSPMSSFGKKDTVIVAVSTSTSDPMAAVAGKIGAKWTYQDGQVVNDESKDISFSGPGVTDFQVAKPDGWPAGSYKVEISLDGTVVQSKDFTVK